IRAQESSVLAPLQIGQPDRAVIETNTTTEISGAIANQRKQGVLPRRHRNLPRRTVWYRLSVLIKNLNEHPALQHAERAIVGAKSNRTRFMQSVHVEDGASEGALQTRP